MRLANVVPGLSALRPQSLQVGKGMVIRLKNRADS